MGGQRGWRLGIIRLAGDLTPVVSAVCVVSEARPMRGRIFRMMTLAVEGKLRGRRIATEAIARLKAELAPMAGPGFGLRADLAWCMEKGGAGFYERQGWAGGEGVWSWRAEVPGLEGAGAAPKGPAQTGGSGEAQAGGKAATAVSEGAGGGAGVGEDEAAGVVASEEVLG